MGPGLTGGVPSVEFFLRDSSPYLRVSGWVVSVSPIEYSRVPGLWGECPPCVCVAGVFLRDLSPYLRDFRRKTTENFERLGR